MNEFTWTPTVARPPPLWRNKKGPPASDRQSKMQGGWFYSLSYINRESYLSIAQFSGIFNAK